MESTLRQLEDAGRPIPPSLAEWAAKQDIELWPGNVTAWQAWAVCSHGRGGGMGPAGISLREIEAWFRLNGEPADWKLIEKIQLVDRVWLEHQAKEMEGNKPAPPAKHAAAKP